MIFDRYEYFDVEGEHFNGPAHLISAAENARAAGRRGFALIHGRLRDEVTAIEKLYFEEVGSIRLTDDGIELTGIEPWE